MQLVLLLLLQAGPGLHQQHLYDGLVGQPGPLGQSDPPEGTADKNEQIKGVGDLGAISNRDNQSEDLWGPQD